MSWRLLDAAEAAVAALWPRRWARLTPYAFLLPAVLLVLILAVGLVTLADASLRPLDPATYRLSAHYGLGNYALVFERAVYWHIIWRSLLAAVVVTAAALVLGFPYAYVMVRTPSAALRKLLLVSLFLPFFIGQVVRAYGWLIILGQKGLLNAVLLWLGLEPARLIYTYPAVLIGLVQFMLPFAVLMLAPAITAIGEEVELASQSLGAGWLATFRHVVLPMARPGLVGAAVVVFTLTLTDFAIPMILGGGKNDFAANAIYDAFFRVSDAGLGSALSIVLVVIGTGAVAAVFAVVGAGTLSFTARAER
ncbi:MAG: ABC transporter permease [Rhodospirillaceae bacterium]|nr:ABC transporter permease [Rhodospirillaceae bacterium]